MIEKNPEEWVVVLGCGYSINTLPSELVEWINNCKARIAINKFGYFFDKTRIKPTDLYFHDCKDETAKFFLRESIKKISSLGEIKLYLSPSLKRYVCENQVKYKIQLARHILSHTIIRLLKKFVKPLSLKYFRLLKDWIGSRASFRPLYYKNKKKIRFVKIKDLFSEDNKWSETYEKPLYHFRGSLTTVLNVISIEYPYSKVLVLGVDLIDKRYFFDNELEDLFLKQHIGKDWTTAYMEKEGKHFSAIEMKGVTMIDRINYCIDRLELTENFLYAYPANNASVLGLKVNVFQW